MHTMDKFADDDSGFDIVDPVDPAAPSALSCLTLGMAIIIGIVLWVSFVHRSVERNNAEIIYNNQSVASTSLGLVKDTRVFDLNLNYRESHGTVLTCEKAIVKVRGEVAELPFDKELIKHQTRGGRVYYQFEGYNTRYWQL